MKISKPYSNCSLSQVTQVFGANPCSYQPTGHTGVDFAFPSCYGTFLVAPARVKISKIITDTTLDKDYYPDFQKGYGILMQNYEEPNTVYLYWHCMQVFMVKEGDIVNQGEVVARIGNSGMCYSGGILVPLGGRGTKGSHLHFEKRINGVCVNPLPDIDWSIPVKLDTLKVAQQYLVKYQNFILNRK